MYVPHKDEFYVSIESKKSCPTTNSDHFATWIDRLYFDLNFDLNFDLHFDFTIVVVVVILYFSNHFNHFPWIDCYSLLLLL